MPQHNELATTERQASTGLRSTPLEIKRVTRVLHGASAVYDGKA